jgi:glucose-6-phosphate isomerase
MDKPFTFEFNIPRAIPSRFDHHLLRSLSDLKGQFYDQEAYERSLSADDTLVYEVYEVKRPEVSGELSLGISIVHPGKVSNEYFMTKGHFHNTLNTAEVYYCLKGEGQLVMETPEGDWAVERLYPGRVLYVPPRWAHRSVNTGTDQDLVTFFVYPSHAGHDYETIERQGFRKLVVEIDGQVQVIDNPRWKSQV